VVPGVQDPDDPDRLDHLPGAQPEGPLASSGHVTKGELCRNRAGTARYSAK